MRIGWGLARQPKAMEIRNSYTDIVTQALVAAAAGNSTPSPDGLGVVQAVSQLWAKCFAAATVTPAGAVDPAVLADIGYGLATTGEFVALLEFDEVGRPVLRQAASVEIAGDFRPESWRYLLSLPGPSVDTRRRAVADEVVHVRINATSAAPWAGRSPIQAAHLTGRLAALLERSIGDESGGPTGSLVTAPEGTGDVSKLSAALSALRGRLGLVESHAGGYGDKAAAPARDWKPERLGPAFTSAEVSLRESVCSEIASIYGISSVILGASSDGTAMRESLRRYLRVTIQPLAKVAAVELGRVLEQDVSFSFEDLRASDVTGAARAWRSLAGPEAVMDQQQAARLTGLE